MKTIYLLKIDQNGHVRYFGSADARTLVRMAETVPVGSEQEAQRPIDGKRLRSLATYVGDGGTLSSSIVIGTKDERIQVHPVNGDDMGGMLYYTEFPETAAEFEDMREAFDVMDGQHRLYSFLPEYIQIPDDENYELSFEMYITPLLEERRIIFKNTNEYQKAVSPTLLMWFRAQLNMLYDNEGEYFDFVRMLSTENASPLQGRIIMGAEHISNGIHADQLVKYFNKINLKGLLRGATDYNVLFNAVCAYLQGWEEAVGSKFKDTDGNVGAFWKIAGLKYMLGLLSTYCNIASTEHKTLTREYVCQKTNRLFNAMGVTPKEFFNINGDYYRANVKSRFAGDSPISQLVEDHKVILLRFAVDDDFNPLA